MKKFLLSTIASVGVCLLILAAGLVAEPTVNRTTVLYDFVNGIKIAGITFFSGTAAAPVLGGSGVTALALEATGTITIGTAATTVVTIATDGSQNADLVVPTNSIGGGEVSGVHFDLIYCGQADENGTIYFGPAAGVNMVTAGTPVSIASATCDGLDSATETTADLVLFPQSAFKVMGMYCMTNGTLGAAETVVFTFRAGAADTTPAITCSLAAGETQCASLTGTTTNVAAGVATAIKAVEVSNNSDDDFWCSVSIMLQ